MRIIFKRCSQNGSESLKQSETTKNNSQLRLMKTKKDDSIFMGVLIKRLHTPS